MTASKTPFLVVAVNGKQLSNRFQRQVKSLTITFREKKADTGTLTLSDPDSALVDSRSFSKGKELSFTMGWTDDSQPRGPYVVKKYRPSFPPSGEPKLIVEFQDKSHKLNKKQKRRRFDNQTPSEVVKTIAKENGLGFNLESIGGVKFTDEMPLIQANITDGALLQRLAERYGYVWGVEGNTLYFRRPLNLDDLKQQGGIATLYYRTNDHSLDSFEPNLKFTKGGKRKGAKKGTSNLNLDSGKVFSLDSAREAVSKIPGIGRVVALVAGEETDDDEPSASSVNTTDSQAQSSDAQKTRTRDKPTTDVGIAQGIITYVTESAQALLENVETEPGNKSGTATPSNEDEASKQDAGKFVRASDIIEGTANPRVASMRWRPGNAVIISGVGDRMSGKYRVTEVTQSITDSGSFTSALKVKKRTMRPANKTDLNQAAAVNSADGKPDKSNKAEDSVYIDIAAARVGVSASSLASSITLIDGQEDS